MNNPSGETTGTAQNVDSVEVEKFSTGASRWWDMQSEFKPLHQINPLRLGFIDRRTPLKKQRVLDVGCGGGILSESMALRGAVVTAIDMSEAALNVARMHAVESDVSIDYQHATAEQFAAREAGNFDIVTCLELLEHVPDPASVVRACSALVKPGGSVYFSTINRNPKAFALAIIGAEYLMGMLPRGTHQYEKLIRPSELRHWCEQSGLGFEEITGMHYSPISDSYWLAPGVDVNYLVQTVNQ